MFGLRFMKAAPTTYVLHYKAGSVAREGAGLAFFYYAPTSCLVGVPLQTTGVPFAFTETTADFQTVTLQGQLTYRVAEPRKLAGALDFAVAPGGDFTGDGPEKLTERLTHTAQVLTRAVTQRMPLRETLVSSDVLVREVLAGLRGSETVTRLGVEVLDVSILGVRPTPDMAKALEAEARESLQRRADEAVYSRRNAAVEQERLIKESEMDTEIAVETKRRQVRETQMAAEIAVEQQRTALIDRRTANDRKDADARAYALEATLKPVRDIDWRTLTAMNGGGDSKSMIALAFRELAENAQKIGELNITPDLLRSLLGGAK